MIDILRSSSSDRWPTERRRPRVAFVFVAVLAGIACGATSVRLLDRGVAAEPLESSVERVDALLADREEGGDGLSAHCANISARMGHGIEALGRVAASDHAEAAKARRLLAALKNRIERVTGALPGKE